MAFDGAVPVALKREHLRRPSKRRRLRNLDFFHAADGATPLALGRPQTVTAVQDASQHGWLNSVPLLRPVDVFEPPNATAETTPRLLGIGPSLRLKETRKKKRKAQPELYARLWFRQPPPAAGFRRILVSGGTKTRTRPDVPPDACGPCAIPQHRAG